MRSLQVVLFRGTNSLGIGSPDHGGIQNEDLQYETNRMIKLSNNTQFSIKQVFIVPSYNHVYPVLDNAQSLVDGEPIFANKYHGRIIEPNSILQTYDSLKASMNNKRDAYSISNCTSLVNSLKSNRLVISSVALILANESGYQMLITDAGNAPSAFQLGYNSDPNNANNRKLVSGTKFGIASAFFYDQGIPISITELDFCHYLIHSLYYYPRVSNGNIPDVSSIVNAYNGTYNNSQYSMLAMYLWRHALYGGLAIESSYASQGYRLKPECACEASLTSVRAQRQARFRGIWAMIPAKATYWYLLSLYMKYKNIPNTRDGINAFNSILGKPCDNLNEQDKVFCQKVINKFVERVPNIIALMRDKGMGNISYMNKLVDNAPNPLVSIWKYAREFVIVKHSYVKTLNEGPDTNRHNTCLNLIDQIISHIPSWYDSAINAELNYFLSQ